MITLWQDLRYALRMLRKSPGFTITAVATLALGIGVNVAIFSVVDAFLFRLLPFKDPAQLTYFVSQRNGGSEGIGFSHPDFEDIRDQTAAAFSDASLIEAPQSDGISVDGKNEPILTQYVAGNFFAVLGIKPALGRLILPSEGDVPSADPILVLSYQFWKTDFGGDPGVVGKRAAINGHPVTIVGVAPERFHGIISLVDMQGYLPLGMAAFRQGVGQNFLGDRATSRFALIARLKGGVSLQQAQGPLDVVAHRLSQQYPTTDSGEAFRARALGPLGPIVGANPVPIVATLFLTLAGLVLLLACMNVTNLLLARAITRRRQMAVRAALGASQWRLIEQSLIETIALAFLGGALGVVLATWARGALRSVPIQFYRFNTSVLLDLSFDWHIFSYAFGVAVFAGVFVGVVPALRVSGSDLNVVLHEGGSMATEKRHRLRHGLVIAQVGGSLMLLIVAGLFVRNLANAEHTDLGFDSGGVLNLSMSPNQAGYSDVQGQQFLHGLLERVRALPGVESASLAACIPMSPSYGALVQIEGYQAPAGQQVPFVEENMIASDYFTTMRIPILRGRAILDLDTENSQPVAVINEAMAAEFWPGQNPIGKRFIIGGPHSPLQVVGVAKNSRTNAFSATIGPYFYVPLAQNRRPTTPVWILQVRAAAPLTMAHGIIELIDALAPTLPVFNVQTMSQALDSVTGLMLFKMSAGAAAALGVLGLLLALVGIYGVVSYSASQRTHEIGIRMALGAKPGQMLAMILWQGCVTVGSGLIVGILASMGMARLIGNLLVGVTATDPLTYLSVSVLLALVALGACCIPARRAMKVDPIVALRYE